jgi:hypothetical protein
MKSKRTASCKRNDFECGEIWLSEHINLEILSPRQDLDKVRGTVHKLLVLGTELLVYDCGEPCDQILS